MESIKIWLLLVLLAGFSLSGVILATPCLDQFYAVLTGDLVKSSDLSPAQLDAVRSSLLGAVEKVRKWKRGLVVGKAEFFRGDSWQLLLADPGVALRVAVFLRASLRAQDFEWNSGVVDTRLSIGLGTVDAISRTRISLSTGEAFRCSGRALDELRGAQLAISVPEVTPVPAGWLSVVATLCDSLIRQWSRRQAELVAATLMSPDKSHEMLGAELDPPVSQQAVAKTLKSSHWQAILPAIQEFESTCWMEEKNNR